MRGCGRIESEAAKSFSKCSENFWSGSTIVDNVLHLLLRVVSCLESNEAHRISLGSSMSSQAMSGM